MKRTGMIVLPCGTLSCEVVASAFRERDKHPEHYNTAVARLIDIGWNAPDLSGVPPMQKIMLGNAPIRDLLENTHRYDERFRMVIKDQLKTTLDQLDAGQLVPTPVHAALIFRWNELQTKLRHALLELLNQGVDSVVIWVIASVSSTTGRSIVNEVCMLANSILRKEGVRAR